MEFEYILIQCDLGAEKQIIEELTKLQEVKEVRGTYGAYDIFIKLEAESKEKLEQILTNNIRTIPKIYATNTLTPILSQGGR